MQLSKRSDFWHADSSNMIIGHNVKIVAQCNICLNCCGFTQFPVLLLNLDFLYRYEISKILKFLSSSVT